MSRAIVESDWRKFGIYPLNPDQPLNTSFMKKQALKERSVAIESPQKQPDIVRGDTVVKDIRGARNRTRELEKALTEEQAKTAPLTVQVELLNAQVTELSTSKSSPSGLGRF